MRLHGHPACTYVSERESQTFESLDVARRVVSFTLGVRNISSHTQ